MFSLCESFAASLSVVYELVRANPGLLVPNVSNIVRRTCNRRPNVGDSMIKNFTQVIDLYSSDKRG